MWVCGPQNIAWMREGVSHWTPFPDLGPESKARKSPKSPTLSHAVGKCGTQPCRSNADVLTFYMKPQHCLLHWISAKCPWTAPAHQGKRGVQPLSLVLLKTTEHCTCPNHCALHKAVPSFIAVPTSQVLHSLHSAHHKSFIIHGAPHVARPSLMAHPAWQGFHLWHSPHSSSFI